MNIPQVDLNNYQIIRCIGHGGYGQVHLIQEKTTSTQYASKTSFHEHFKNDDFDKELNILSKVENPAILRIYGYSLTDFNGFNNPVLITEYMSNVSLDKSMKNLTPTQKYIVLIGISIGMKSLHSHGIIHRDLKPENILLNEKFYPKICDFGVSYISNLELSQIIMKTTTGTILYQAPEILDSDDGTYNYKIDIYSFSMIFYEIITGEKPFKNIKNAYKLQNDVVKGIRPDVLMIKEFSIKNFLELCWSNEPTIRPSFDAIVEELLDEKYQKYFNADKEKVEEYLALFPDELKVKNTINNVLNELNEKSKKGNSDTLFRLAVMYDEGDEGVEIDKKKACELYQEACDLGNSDAMITYGRKLLKGDGIPVDKEKAAEIYKKFADLGNAKAMNNYGLMLLFGDGIKQNKKEAARYLKMAADEGNPTAMLKYADMLFYGDGITKNKKDAAKYYQNSAQNGNVKAMFNYACMLLLGDEITCDKKKAAELMKNAADNKNVDAIFNYGVMLFRGDGVEKNKKESIHYIKKAIQYNSEAAKDFYNKYISDDADSIDFDDSSKTYDSSKIIDLDEIKALDLSNLIVFVKRIVTPLILQVIKSCDLKKESMNNVDIIFYDGPFSLEKYIKMNPSKHMIKIPGLNKTCYKSNFFKSLYNNRDKYSDEIDEFVPLTFQIPEELKQFQRTAKKSEFENRPWILRKDKSTKKGIHFISDSKEITNESPRSIVQPFIQPYLIDGRKFDIRIYLMITNLEPLTIYIYKESISYFCNDLFTTATKENLTSYSFDKRKPLNEDINPIRYSTPILQQISNNNEELIEKIEKISYISILSILDEMKTNAQKACEINDKSFPYIDKIPPLNRFYNLIAIDILIDNKKKPIVIGINDNPGMKPFNETDKRFKTEIIQSEFELIASFLNKATSENNKWKKIVLTNNNIEKNCIENDSRNISFGVKRITCPIFLAVMKDCEINKESIKDADVIIYDGPFSLEKYININPSKHVNKIPDLNKTCYKSNFFKSLYNNRDKYSDEFDEFVPLTFQIPEELKQFQRTAKKSEFKNRPWILRKDKSTKKGIHFISDPKEITNESPRSIVQPFIQPYLIDGRKFDIRIYLMITNLEPLTIYIYKESISYFCNDLFTTATKENLTSYSFDKRKPLNEDINPIRYSKSILQQISNNNEELIDKIERISYISILSILEEAKRSTLKACEINDKSFPDIDKIPPLNRFYNLVAIDILIDDKKKPIVIGINDNPGMKPFNETDKRFKTEIIQSEFELIQALLSYKTPNKKWKKIAPK